MQSFRSGVEKYGKWLVVLITIPFAFFGIESFFFSGASVEEAARVDGERITRLELEQAVERQRSWFQQRFGQVDPEMLSAELLRGPALENLIATTALELRGRGEGMGAAPQLIAKVLGDAEPFQIDGKFSRDNYLVYLRQTGYTPQTHNRFLARELVVSQLARGVTQSAFVSRQELDVALTAFEETRDFSYLEIPVAKLRNEVALPEADVEAYYEEHSDRFSTPEQVVLNYLELTREGIAAQLDIDEALLQERYQERLDEAEAASRPILAQILVKPAADGAEPGKLQQIQQLLNAGKDFAELAKTESEDPLSAENGGEIGPYVADEFPAELRPAIEALAVGQVSAPVKTEEGWHIFKVVRDDKPNIGSFAEERDALRGEIAGQEAETLFGERLDRLVDLAYSGDSLEAVAKETELPLQISGPLTRSGGDGIGAEPKVIAAAFAEDALKNRHLSPVIELGEGRALVVQVRDHQVAAIRPFAEVRAQAEEELRSERAAALANERATALRDQIAAGGDLEKLAAADGFEAHAHTEVGRYGQQLDRSLIEAVFGVPAGEAPASRVLPGEDRVFVYQVTRIQPGVPAEIPEERRKQLRQVLQGAIANQEMGGYQELVLAGAEVRVREQPAAPE